MKKYLFGFLLLATLTTYGQAEDVTTTDAVKSSSFKLYPNPAVNGIVYLTQTNNSNKEITIYDLFGELVLKDRITSNTIDISRLVSGVYMLQVIEGNKTMTRKLVVK